MAFDMGFNFRDTAIYVTDPAYAVPVLGEVYPHTYTNANGFSIDAGWVTDAALRVNRDAANDPRIAGINYTPSGSQRIFQVDLNSGSAPGAGAYSVDIAMGDAGSSQTVFFQLLDNVTVKIDGNNGTAGYGQSADEYRDATLANVPATTTWTGTPAAVTFASTTAFLKIGLPDGANPTLAHFRLALASAGAGSLFMPIHKHLHMLVR